MGSLLACYGTSEWNPSVTALVTETHGEAMRMIASLVGQHFEGGNQAARVLKREKKISPATSRRLDCLAIAYSLVRHIDVVMCRDFLRDLELELRDGPQNREFSEEAHENVQEQIVDSVPPYEESYYTCVQPSPSENRSLQV